MQRPKRSSITHGTFYVHGKLDPKFVQAYIDQNYFGDGSSCLFISWENNSYLPSLTSQSGNCFRNELRPFQ